MCYKLFYQTSFPNHTHVVKKRKKKSGMYSKRVISSLMNTCIIFYKPKVDSIYYVVSHLSIIFMKFNSLYLVFSRLKNKLSKHFLFSKKQLYLNNFNNFMKLFIVFSMYFIMHGLVEVIHMKYFSKFS